MKSLSPKNPCRHNTHDLLQFSIGSLVHIFALNRLIICAFRVIYVLPKQRRIPLWRSDLT
nr:MAG TPA: hypothetical protein [Caudoviricetes sp.]